MAIALITLFVGLGVGASARAPRVRWLTELHEGSGLRHRGTMLRNVLWFMRLLMFVVIMIIVTTSLEPVASADYPTKPIKIFVPQAPGGKTDVLARYIAGSIQKYLGQLMVIDNRSGGNGSWAAAQLERANTDGYSLLLWVSSFDAHRAVRAAPVATIATKDGVVYGLVAPVGTADSIICSLEFGD